MPSHRLRAEHIGERGVRASHRFRAPFTWTSEILANVRKRPWYNVQRSVITPQPYKALMDTYRNNSGAGTARRTARSAVSASTRRGAASGTASRAGASSTRARRGAAARGSASASNGRRERQTTRARGRRASNLMRYAADSKFVQMVYGFITGPTRPIFIGLVALAVAIGVYFPVRDLYSAYRTHDILQRQLEVRDAYNADLEREVDSLLSTEGIEDAAREELGLVLPGEHAVTVVGLDEEGEEQDGKAETSGSDERDTSKTDDASEEAASGDEPSDDPASSEPSEEGSASAKVEEAERAAADEAPWYIKVFDVVFLYGGVEGQTVASSGE